MMKMAKPSAKDIAAAEELQQVLIALDQNQRWGCAALEDTPDFFQLIDDDEFDPEQGQHAQALYNKLVTLMWENPSFHNRVISGMCHVIMYEKNEIIDPDSDCIDLHPRFAEMWNDLKRETQAARYWNKRYHQVVAERDYARAKLAAMEHAVNVSNQHLQCYRNTYGSAPADKPAVAVPDGWKLVPIDPTGEMANAALNAEDESIRTMGHSVPFLDLWHAMLTAAPSINQQVAPLAAVPDEIHEYYKGDEPGSDDYMQGWNDCRDSMIAATQSHSEQSDQLQTLRENDISDDGHKCTCDKQFDPWQWMEGERCNYCNQKTRED